ncbi:hypothetical protein [Sphingopyxis fribergensis]
MRWGVKRAHHWFGPPEKARTTYWLRELWPEEKALLEPAHRCLIILDSFALPDGAAGERTRTWHGYDARPIFAWAGVWREGRGGAGFAGIVVDAAPPLDPQRTMPLLIAPADYAIWLEADLLSAVRLIKSDADPDLYREPTDQPWGADREP